MSLKQPLVSLLTSDADAGDHLVAFGSSPGSERRRSHLLADVGALAARLGSKRGASWLVEAEDAYRVAVAVLAAAATGCRVVLPPNLQPGTLAQLRSRCDVVLTGGDSAAHDALDPLEPGSLADAARAKDVAVDRDAPLVDLFTSGTSGPGKLVTKALRHLEDEVVELERGFGAGIDEGAVVLATVPAHHLYGLLFRVLWPLAAGRPFCRTSFLLPDELLARTARASGAVIVSSPAHLRHLAASPRLAEQAAVIRTVFSSGGPLETNTALDMEAVLGAAPLEIFGSTETGGVASRRASREDPSPPWTPFEPVHLAAGADGRLEVTSPFVTPPAGAEDAPAGTWCMGDSVSLVGGRFRLLGRSDRIAKVGEKSLSLPEIEQALAEHDAVECAVVGSYRERSTQRLGALVVLSPQGRRKLALAGRRALQAELAEHLASRWDRVALPRRWRFREFLAVDARGKFVHEAFETELARPADEVRDPLLLSEERDGDAVVLRFVVPRDLAYLDGHYDAFPLVPGAVQILWVLAATGRLLGRSVSAQRMEAIKFKSVLRPAQEFAMRLRVDQGETREDGARVAFTLAGDGRVFSSGRLTLFS
ncbi:MAG: AMP-binding protein [Candidatus Binatia bacterium]